MIIGARIGDAEADGHDAEKGRLNRTWLESFAADVACLHKRGQEVILVSSGAIALGRRHLGLAPGKVPWR